MTPPTVDLSVSTNGVSEAVRDRIMALDAAAADADGVRALDDQVRLDLAHPPAPALHLLGRRYGADEVIGYSHADLRPGKAVSAHLVVDPDRRRHGVGTALLEALVREWARFRRRAPLRVWAHGDTPGAQAFAAREGFERVRELRRMWLGPDVPLPSPSYPSDVVVRTFVPGVDDEAWVAVNAAAFSGHPEQGRLGVDDLRQRIVQSWFDPTGFFVVERHGRMLGYHWTKVHPSGGANGAPIGEVYVLGVHPEAQGLGLGRALALTGLHSLRERGLGEVMLYVDGDNLAAVSVYERLGLVNSSVDAMYARR